ncbi:MAG: MFS transporter [Anaerolineae bacterium]|jgi:FHS family Na+ dependent glucose MFS transporter 1
MPSKTARHWPKTLGYFAVFVAVGLETASLGPTLSGLAEQTNTQLDAISFLFTAHALGYMLGSFFGGRLYDRVPGHPLMAGMLALVAAMLALIPLVPALWLLTVAWLLLGVGGGALDVGGNTLIVWVHGRKVGPFMNALHFFFGVGSFLAPVIVGQALTLSGGISWGYWLLALLVLPVALWLLRVPSPSSPNRMPHDTQQSGSNAEDALRSELQQTTTGRGKIVLLIALLLLFYVGAESAFGGWIYTFAIALDLSDAATAAYLTSAFWGALTFGRLVSIPLAARYRPCSILLADLLGCLASVSVILLWPTSALAVWLGALGLGFAMASIFPTAISLAERRIPITGQVTGWFLVAASIGAMSIPWLIGQLFEPLGPPSVMWVILLDLAAGLLVLGILLRSDTPTQISSEE